MKMPFGKHAGRAIADLPGNYLAWFAREGFPKGELGELLELMHTLDHNGLRGLLAPIQQSHKTYNVRDKFAIERTMTVTRLRSYETPSLAGGLL